MRLERVEQRGQPRNSGGGTERARLQIQRIDRNPRAPRSCSGMLEPSADGKGLSEMTVMWKLRRPSREVAEDERGAAPRWRSVMRKVILAGVDMGGIIECGGINERGSETMSQ